MTKTPLARIKLPSNVRLTAIVDAFTDEFGKFTGLDSSERHDLGLATREALVNAISHGSGQDPSNEVELDFAVVKNGLEIRIRDQGDGFDPAECPDPTSDEGVLRTSGRGLFMMRALVDKVRIRRTKGGGTEVVLRKLHKS